MFCRRRLLSVTVNNNFYKEEVKMYKEKRILAIIPARGGSKGIPNKNLVELCGKPLIAYSILSAKKSIYIDDVIVSTDSLAIKEIAVQYGADVPFLRPSELATDTSKTIDCVIYTITELEKMGHIYDYVILLQPTQPIREKDLIDNAIEKLLASSEKSLVSVTSVSEHPILMRTITKEGTLKSLLNTSSTVRRQDFPEVYRVNGSIYINSIDESLNETTSLNVNVLPYFIPVEQSIDIDSIEDLELAKKYLLTHNI